MARKKAKRTSRNTRDAAPEHELPGGFWRQVVAVLMIALAVFLVMTWFGNGGVLLEKVNEAMLWAIGYAQYLIPVLLVYLAVRIFRSEDNRVSVAVWIASFLMIFWVSGVFGIPTIGQEVRTGGMLGEGLNIWPQRFWILGWWCLSI